MDLIDDLEYFQVSTSEFPEFGVKRTPTLPKLDGTTKVPLLRNGTIPLECLGYSELPNSEEINPHPPEVRRYDQSPIASQRGNASGMSGLSPWAEYVSKRGRGDWQHTLSATGIYEE